MLASRAGFIAHITTHQLGSVSRYSLKATFSERQNGLMNYFDALSDFILLNHQRRCQPDDITMGRFGKKSVIAKPQTHLPGIVVCNERKDIYTVPEEAAHFQHVV